MIMLSDARTADDGDSIEPVPLGQGELPRDVIRRLLKEHVPPATPIVLRPAAAGAAAGLAGCVGDLYSRG